MNELSKKTFDLAQPEQALQVAAILQKFVKEKHLTANIKGKEYPLVEAWMFAGSQLGLYPLMVEIKNLSTETEIKYMATVEIRRIADNSTIARGIALCSNREQSKRSFDEYAILSMAQTRATGKAFRNVLAWIMKAAGFEATPAEEMDFTKAPDFYDVPSEEERQLLRELVYSSDLDNEEREAAMATIDLCSSYPLYQKIQHRLEARQKDINQIINPSATDINKHLRKAIKK